MIFYEHTSTIRVYVPQGKRSTCIDCETQTAYGTPCSGNVALDDDFLVCINCNEISTAIACHGNGVGSWRAANLIENGRKRCVVVSIVGELCPRREGRKGEEKDGRQSCGEWLSEDKATTLA